MFGIPDEKYGEVVCAWIIAKPGAEVSESGLRKFCRDQISHFKVPAHFSFVDEFTLTNSGKPQKFIMRERMMKMLG